MQQPDMPLWTCYHSPICNKCAKQCCCVNTAVGTASAWDVWHSGSSAHQCCFASLLQAIASFIDWLCAQLRRPSNPTKSVPTAVSALAVLLREKGARTLFTRSGGVQLLSPLLRSCNSPTNSQILYEICLCLWQLSYHKPAAEVMASSGRLARLAPVFYRHRLQFTD